MPTQHTSRATPLSTRRAPASSPQTTTGPVGALDQAREGRLEGLEGAVVVEVVGLHVEQSQRVGPKLAKGPVALVDFDDELVVSPVPVGPDAEHRRPDQPSVVATGGERDLDHHRRGGRLAVGPREPDDARRRRPVRRKTCARDSSSAPAARAATSSTLSGATAGRPQHDLGAGHVSRRRGRRTCVDADARAAASRSRASTSVAPAHDRAPISASSIASPLMPAPATPTT